MVNEATIDDPDLTNPVVVSATTVVEPDYVVYFWDFEADDGGFVGIEDTSAIDDFIKGLTIHKLHPEAGLPVHFIGAVNSSHVRMSYPGQVPPFGSDPIAFLFHTPGDVRRPPGFARLYRPHRCGQGQQHRRRRAGGALCAVC